MDRVGRQPEKKNKKIQCLQPQLSAKQGHKPKLKIMSQNMIKFSAGLREKAEMSSNCGVHYCTFNVTHVKQFENF